MKPFRIFLLPLCLALLAACVAPYKPHLSDTAAKVRIKMTGGSDVVGSIWPIVDGKCGERMRLPQLLAFAEPSTALAKPKISMETVPSHARAGMQDSPDPRRSDVSELQLAPGQYLFSLLNASGGYGSTVWHCGVARVVAIDASRQYEIELRLEGGPAARQCRIITTRLEEQDGRSLWRPYRPLDNKACPT